MPQSWSTTASAIFSTEAPSDTSQATAVACPPKALTPSLTSWMVSGVRPTTATDAPAAARHRQMSAPSHPPPPVTTAVRPRGLAQNVGQECVLDPVYALLDVPGQGHPPARHDAHAVGDSQRLLHVLLDEDHADVLLIRGFAHDLHH